MKKCSTTILISSSFLLLQICQLDSEVVKVSALHSLFDIILTYGMNYAKEIKEEKSVSKHKSADRGLLSHCWRLTVCVQTE